MKMGNNLLLMGSEDGAMFEVGDLSVQFGRLLDEEH